MQVLTILREEQYYHKNSLHQLAGQFRVWKKITLPDESKWLIKKGNKEERYIHIHPAKFSEHTIQVRATTLKTVLTLCIHKIPIHDDAEHNLRSVNEQRISFLQLSPIKSLDEEDSGILKLWQLFVNAGAII